MSMTSPPVLWPVCTKKHYDAIERLRQDEGSEKNKTYKRIYLYIKYFLRLVHNSL